STERTHASPRRHRLWMPCRTFVTSFGDGTGLAAPRPKGLRAVAVVSAAGGFRYQRFEEREILALFGMPQDAEGEAARWVLQALHGAVGGMRRHVQAVADSAEALMVVRLHVVPVAEDLAELRPRIDRHVVVGEHA